MFCLSICSSVCLSVCLKTEFVSVWSLLAPCLITDVHNYAVNVYTMLYKKIKGIIEISPQSHLFSGQSAHLHQEPKNHPDLVQTCCYEVWNCQEPQNHHPSRPQSPFLHS